jgi:putative transposase
MKNKRNRYSAAEKSKIALEAIKGDLTLSEISSKYRVHATQINKWKKQALDYLAMAFTEKFKQPDNQEEKLAELYQQIGQLKVENDFLKKKVICLTGDRRILLEPNHASLSLRKQCALLDINRSSVYYTPKVVDAGTLALMRHVDEIYTQSPFFGTRQMTQYLRLHGYTVGRTRIRSIYEHLGLRSVAPGPHTSRPHPKHKIYPYLLRDVAITKRDQVWSTDITYLRLHKGFVYLAAIIDWFSRYVLDWELSISLEADFCIDVLSRTLSNGKCDIFNTDQGSQFTSQGFTNLLIDHEVKISMDGKGRALDNVFVERLWRSVKYECVYLQEWESVKKIRQGLVSYFNFYNYERPHQGLHGKTPASLYLL